MRMVIEQIVLIRRLSLSLSLLSILSFVFSRFSYLFSLSWFSRSVATRQSKLFRKVFQKSRYERSFPYARGPAHYESARRRLLLLFPLGGRHGNAAPHETKKLSVSLSLSLSLFFFFSAIKSRRRDQIGSSRFFEITKIEIRCQRES